ncbi:MAG TPA: phosphotransferase, partial [Acidobacteriota bacterium]|nr:phosphotransferase [Acidobacteriota bacterium]
HVRPIDIGGFHRNGSLLSVKGLTEFFLLVEFHEGEGYQKDLFRLQKTGTLTDTDIQRSDALCDYLVQIHAVAGTTKSLYQRRIRELMGHGECIMGLTDSYPPHDSLMPPDLLERIEHLCLSWRWRLKNREDRLCQVHGDFHPWNLLFRDGTDFSVLDRSRGEYGEAADDVTCLTMNYLFFSLQSHGELRGPFETLFHRFWERYIEKTGDQEILQLCAPFFAFRGLVMASPVWYPNLTNQTREKIVAFILNVLESESFDPSGIHQYYKP